MKLRRNLPKELQYADNELVRLQWIDYWKKRMQ